jgi:cytosine/adenosine deaminase-related metal-dependent hydrolase/ubiquinone/menaquinone biosynthesis C-methylase UbiE
MKSNRNSVISPEVSLRNQQAFAAWAPVYDAQPNPLLTLEERYLGRLLPRIRGRNVLDAGCGSGRWLRYLDDQTPNCLKGVDPSDEMLQVAAGKNTSAELLLGSCEDMPFPDMSFDLILSSFVLSYVDELLRCAAELNRVAQPGCDLFLSDMHPETRRILGWKRSFVSANRTIELSAERCGLNAIVAAFTQVGWTLCASLDPEFGLPEQQVFESAGRLENFRAAAGHPVIYILHLQKPSGDNSSASEGACPSDSSNAVHLRGANWAVGPGELQAASSGVVRSHIVSIISDRLNQPSAAHAAESSIDLSGYLLLPGLTNAHDHLEFALFPRLATTQYNNATEWAEDIHQNFAGTISLHRSISMRTRLLWGGIRNLLSGVTTVCHHNPLSPDLEANDFPVHVVRRYGWGHSLRFCGDLRAAYDATPEDAPFLVHACEGTDPIAFRELGALDEIGILTNRTIMIHGLGLGTEGAELLRRRGVSLIICPSSNQFLFGQVPSSGVLGSVDAIALGSDSPLTSCGDLLDEIRFAVQHCGLSPQRIYSMVTESPAAMLRFPHGNGSLRISAPGDAIAVRDTGLSPAEALCSLSFANVELVLRNGHPFLASDELMRRLPTAKREGLEPLSIAGTIRWLRAPVSEMLREAESVLGIDQVMLGGKQVSHANRHSGYIAQNPPKGLTHAG